MLKSMDMPCGESISWRCREWEPVQFCSLSENSDSDFVSKFDTCEKFCKWCNLSPNNKITGGKLISSHIPRRKNPVGQILRQCANTVKSEKSEMGAYFRRMKSKDGHMQAIVATARTKWHVYSTRWSKPRKSTIRALSDAMKKNCWKENSKNYQTTKETQRET